jgi:hypothetical protein
LGGQRGRNANPINVNVTYTLSDSALDAKPYSITGNATQKPEYLQNNFGATVGGPLNIGSFFTNNNFNVNYNGSRSTNPSDQYYTVPTAAQRSGDFRDTVVSSTQFVNGQTVTTTQPVSIFDPNNNWAQFVDLNGNKNVIASNRIDPAAAGLLKFMPLPNLPGDTRNYHYVTSTENNSDSINFSIQHTIRPPQQQRGQQQNAQQFIQALQSGNLGALAGIRGGRGGQLQVQVQYQRSNTVSANPFPGIGGSQQGHGLNTSVSYNRSIWKAFSNMQFRVNRNHNEGTNLFEYSNNVAENLGITGVSTDPADWGVPTLSFTNFSSLNDRTPSNTVNMTYRASDNFRLPGRRHGVQFGADFTHTVNTVHSTTGNPRGTFTFSGSGTGLSGLSGSGYDFADFLLGLPARTTIAYGANGHTFISNAYNFFIQDNWQWRGNLTFNYGVRYEYASPYVEVHDHLVNLDAAPDFGNVKPVCPKDVITAGTLLCAGQTGPLTGIHYPRSLVKPNRHNFLPAFGLAWRGPGRFVVRTGYRISYNSGVYSAMANSFVRQPPFAVTQTNTTPGFTPSDARLTLENGFPTPPPSEVTNTFGVDPNYRVGYAHQWNLDVQRDLPLNIQMSLDYTGTKGTHLDVAQAPNRTLTGLRIANVQSFTWETSSGNSIYHGGSVQLQRRFSRGISVGGSYTYSKMIDDASSFNGGSGSGIAQDAFNLRAERAASNSDQRHAFSSNYNWELPLGRNKPFLNSDSVLSRAIGDWQLTGTVTFGSGRPFTPTIANNTCDLSRGTTGTLRADWNGNPIAIGHPTVDQWFNTAAFSDPTQKLVDGVLVTDCTHYGTAGRNLIRGPGTRSFGMTLNKSFRMKSNKNLDVRIQANNVFNMVTYSGINTSVNSTQFGQVTGAGSMRRVTIQARYRF